MSDMPACLHECHQGYPWWTLSIFVVLALLYGLLLDWMRDRRERREEETEPVDVTTEDPQEPDEDPPPDYPTTELHVGGWMVTPTPPPLTPEEEETMPPDLAAKIAEEVYDAELAEKKLHAPVAPPVRSELVAKPETRFIVNGRTLHTVDCQIVLRWAKDGHLPDTAAPVPNFDDETLRAWVRKLKIKLCSRCTPDLGEESPRETQTDSR